MANYLVTAISCDTVSTSQEYRIFRPIFYLKPSLVLAFIPNAVWFLSAYFSLYSFLFLQLFANSTLLNKTNARGKVIL